MEYFKKFKKQLNLYKKQILESKKEFFTSVNTLEALYTPEEQALPVLVSNVLTQLPSRLKSLKNPFDEQNSQLLQETSQLSSELARYMTAETYMNLSSYDAVYTKANGGDSLSQLIADVKTDIRSMKSHLLSTKNFPSALNKVY